MSALAVRVDPFGVWKVALVDAIMGAIRKNRRNGVMAMSVDNLRAVVLAPPGGPTGINVAHNYRRVWFPDAVRALPASYRRDIL